MPRMTMAEVVAHQARIHKKSFEDSRGENEDYDEESVFHEAIIAYLKSIGVHGIVHSRMDQPTTQQVGVPDFLFAVNGVPVALEAKVKNRKPTPAQLGWLQALSMDGWVTMVVRSLEDVKTALSVAANRLSAQKGTYGQTGQKP